MAAPRICPTCGSDDLIYDPSRGDTVCGNPLCGEVIEEKEMVIETSFVHTGGGGVSAATGRVMQLNTGIGNFGHYTSTERTLEKGRDKIDMIARRLQLESAVTEHSFRMYQFATQLMFTHGRPTAHVACACVYISCRQKHCPHLLLDFSDALSTPVKVLGRVYVKFLKRLVGGDPSQQASLIDPHKLFIDPSVFVERFAKKLDLGGQLGAVTSTAMRLIKFMERDWICVGRRPNGIVGAALLVAAHYHGIKCAAENIAEIVRMSEATLRLRLQEMRQTPLALLPVDQFATADLAIVDGSRRAMPPCMVQRQRREARAALLDQERQAGALTDGGRKRRRALQDSPPAKSAREAAAASPGAVVPPEVAMPPPPLPGALAPTSPEPRGAAPPAAKSMHSATQPSAEALEVMAKDITEQLRAHEESSDIGSAAAQSPDALAAARSPLGTEVSASSAPSELWDLGAAVKEGKTAAKIADLVDGKPPFAEPKLPLEQHGSVSEQGEASTLQGKEESLSDVDSEDLEAYLLDAQESQNKSDIWHEVNKEMLQEWYEQAEEKKNRKRSQGDGVSESGSRTSSKRSSHRRFQSASDCTSSAVMALKKKVGNSRINIDVIQDLFDGM